MMAISLGQKELGETEIKKAKDAGYDYGISGIRQLINAYTQIKDWPSVLAQHQEWLQITPDNPSVYASLADTYYRMGDKNKAKEAALEAAKLDPNMQSRVDAFIKSLGL